MGQSDDLGFEPAYPGCPKARAMMVVRLAEHADVCTNDVPSPTPRKITIAGQQQPVMLAANSDHLRIENIVSALEVIVMHDDREAGGA